MDILEIIKGEVRLYSRFPVAAARSVWQMGHAILAVPQPAKVVLGIATACAVMVIAGMIAGRPLSPEVALQPPPEVIVNENTETTSPAGAVSEPAPPRRESEWVKAEPQPLQGDGAEPNFGAMSIAERREWARVESLRDLKMMGPFPTLRSFSLSRFSVALTSMGMRKSEHELLTGREWTFKKERGDHLLSVSASGIDESQIWYVNAMIQNYGTRPTADFIYFLRSVIACSLAKADAEQSSDWLNKSWRNNGAEASFGDVTLRITSAPRAVFLDIVPVRQTADR